MISFNKYISILLFPISPLLALVTSLIKALSKNTVNGFNVLLIITCSILGLINSFKVIESDLILYLKQFELASKLAYFEYIIFNLKDPVYYSLNYFFYNFISGDFKFFLFFTTFISYYFLLIASFKFAKALGLSNRLSIFILIFTALFPQFFSLSAHLIRQFMAISIGYFALYLYYFSKDKSWLSFILIFLSCFIHSSNILFAPLLLMRIRFSEMLKVSYILIPIVILFLMNIDSVNPFFKGFERINDLSKGAALEPLNPLVLYLNFLLLFINISLNINRKIKISKIIFDRIFIFISVLLFIFNYIDNNEIANRLVMYLYFFWPITCTLLLDRFSVSIKSILLLLILIISFFIFSLFFGIWEYNNISIILFPILAILN